MRNDINFTALLNVLCAAVVEVQSFFEHSIFIQVLELIRDHREDVTKLLFKSAYEKNMIVVDESRPQTVGESLSELVSKLASKHREIETRIAYLAGRARQYETFLTRREVGKNIDYCSKVLEFLTICTNNSNFFKTLAVNINIQKPTLTDNYKAFIRAVQKLSLQSSFFLPSLQPRAEP